MTTPVEITDEPAPRPGEKVLDLCFMDTETLGLDPEAPIWEFACIRRVAGTSIQWRQEFFIKHDPTGWLSKMAPEFLDDYSSRYDVKKATPEPEAAFVISESLGGATIIGAVPNFDTERIAKLLLRNGLQPRWYYHLMDVETLAIGWLRAHGLLVQPPWKSDRISKDIGIDPANFNRHTAMGDVLWVQAQYDRLMLDQMRYLGSHGTCDVA